MLIASSAALGPWARMPLAMVMGQAAAGPATPPAQRRGRCADDVVGTGVRSGQLASAGIGVSRGSVAPHRPQTLPTHGKARWMGRRGRRGRAAARANSVRAAGPDTAAATGPRRQDAAAWLDTRKPQLDGSAGAHVQLGAGHTLGTLAP